MSRWGGEQMDYGIAIEALMRHDGLWEAVGTGI